MLQSRLKLRGSQPGVLRTRSVGLVGVSRGYLPSLCPVITGPLTPENIQTAC